MDLGQSVQHSVLLLVLQFEVILVFLCIQCWVIACHYLAIGQSEQAYNYLFTKGLACIISLPPADSVIGKRKTGLHSGTMWCDRDYVTSHIKEICIL